jgi:hypothetical protein
LDNSLAELDNRIAEAHAASDISSKLAKVPGIGKQPQKSTSTPDGGKIRSAMKEQHYLARALLW